MVTTNTRLWRVFFRLFKPDFSWASINCFHGFPRAEGSIIAEWRANNFEQQRLFKIILLRWRITLLKQQGLCELSEIAETFSIVYITVFRLFIYFDVWKHGSGGGLNCQEASINSKKQKISHRKGKKFPLNGGCFRKWILLLIILHVIE